MKTVLSSEEVAKICKVSLESVTNWCDTLGLTHDKIPGNPNWLIPREGLIRFLGDQGIPIPLELQKKGTVLIYSHDDSLRQCIEAEIPDFTKHYRLETVPALELLQRALLLEPECVVVDVRKETANIHLLADSIREIRGSAWRESVYTYALRDQGSNRSWPIPSICHGSICNLMDWRFIASNIKRQVPSYE